jgi:multidrug resistance efflux pump
MFSNLVKKGKKLVGMETEDYKQKFYYSESKVKELEDKLSFLCKQLHSVMQQVDVCTKDIKK